MVLCLLTSNTKSAMFLTLVTIAPLFVYTTEGSSECEPQASDKENNNVCVIDGLPSSLFRDSLFFLQRQTTFGVTEGFQFRLFFNETAVSTLFQCLEYNKGCKVSMTFANSGQNYYPTFEFESNRSGDKDKRVLKCTFDKVINGPSTIPCERKNIVNSNCTTLTLLNNGVDEKLNIQWEPFYPLKLYYNASRISVDCCNSSYCYKEVLEPTTDSKTTEMTTVVNSTGKDMANDPNTLPIVLGVIFSIIPLGIIVLVAFVIWRRRSCAQRNEKPAMGISAMSTPSTLAGGRVINGSVSHNTQHGSGATGNGQVVSMPYSALEMGQTGKDNNGGSGYETIDDDRLNNAGGATAASGARKGATTVTTVPSAGVSGAVAKSNPDNDTSQYTYIDGTDLGEKNEYSRLGEDKKHITNPYNLSSGNSKLRKPLPSPPGPTNKQPADYSMAQHIGDEASNQNQQSSNEYTYPSFNDVKTGDYDYPEIEDTGMSTNKTNPYFELEENNGAYSLERAQNGDQQTYFESEKSEAGAYSLGGSQNEGGQSHYELESEYPDMDNDKPTGEYSMAGNVEDK